MANHLNSEARYAAVHQVLAIQEADQLAAAAQQAGITDAQAFFDGLTDLALSIDTLDALQLAGALRTVKTLWVGKHALDQVAAVIAVPADDVAIPEAATQALTLLPSNPLLFQGILATDMPDYGNTRIAPMVEPTESALDSVEGLVETEPLLEVTPEADPQDTIEAFTADESERAREILSTFFTSDTHKMLKLETKAQLDALLTTLFSSLDDIYNTIAKQIILSSLRAQLEYLILLPPKPRDSSYFNREAQIWDTLRLFEKRYKERYSAEARNQMMQASLSMHALPTIDLETPTIAPLTETPSEIPVKRAVALKSAAKPVPKERPKLEVRPVAVSLENLVRIFGYTDKRRSSTLKSIFDSARSEHVFRPENGEVYAKLTKIFDSISHNRSSESFKSTLAYEVLKLIVIGQNDDRFFALPPKIVSLKINNQLVEKHLKFEEVMDQALSYFYWYLTENRHLLLS